MADSSGATAPNPQVLDTLVSFDEDHTETKPTLIIKREQEIPDEHIAKLKRDKINANHTPAGDFFRFASIPISVVELWDRQGFRIEEHGAKEIVQRLHKEGLDAFVTTNRQI